MSERRSLSKKRRFEVFRRDLFVCQYCGQRPPAVVLEVDHVVLVVEGGSDDDHNLITSRFDCNRGKGARGLAGAPIDVTERSQILEERLEQTRAYEALLSQQRDMEEERIDEVIRVYERFFVEWTLPDRLRPSIRDFLRRLPKTDVIEAMELACSRMNSDRAFRYFCGVCWRKIKGY